MAEGYPAITRTISPEGYGDLVFTMVVNLSVADFTLLVVGYDTISETDGEAEQAKKRDQRLRYGAALSRAFSGRAYPYGLDFTTPEAALATLERQDLPLDLRFWLNNAPAEAAEVYLEGLRKNFRSSFASTPTS